MKPILAAALLALAGCASTPSSEPSTVFDPAAASFTGYVSFDGGEFHLFEREAQMRSAMGRPCVSGVLPLNMQRTARRDLPGQKVTFTGRAVPWAGNSTTTGLTYEGSTVRNSCGGEFVILAEDVSVIR
ncbi:hypothetical protein [Brevundimonas sp. Root1279]|uniref:hypothetical protein n=1 Tax=Brevundimonas sp. Root1279 TaxID=1736443 RepID=UPI0006FB30F5|nr:hypothetical protein [Brevundimonas sp. Root1279]KQW83588.1 hypothetical protein ASC65_02705 [Brevundimonas sp. Root1279]